MKGQLNIEFISAIIVFMIGIGSVGIFAANQIPDVENRAERTYQNLEAHRISDHLMTSQGYSSTYGGDWDQADLGNVTKIGYSTGKFNELDRAKLQRLRSFTRTGGYDQKFNYSRFKRLTDVDGQYHFNFTWMPVVQTTKQVPSSEYQSEGTNIDNLRIYWRMDTLPITDSSGEDVGKESDDIELRDEGALNTNYVYFDGTDSINTTKYFSETEATLSFWLKPRETDRKSMVVGFPEKLGVSFDGSSGDFDIRGFYDSGSGPTYFGRTEIPRNRWVHVAMTTDSSGTEIFVDGVKAIDSSTSASISGELSAGRRPGEPGFEGGIDEIRFYDESLTSSEIRELFRGTDKYSKVRGETLQLPSVPSSGRLTYGESSVFGGIKVLNVKQTSGTETYISEDDSFAGDEVSEGDSLNIGREFRVRSIDKQGKYVVLAEHVKSFGPQPPERGSSIVLQRYGVMDSEPVRMEVTTW